MSVSACVRPQRLAQCRCCFFISLPPTSPFFPSQRAGTGVRAVASTSSKINSRRHIPMVTGYFSDDVNFRPAFFSNFSSEEQTGLCGRSRSPALGLYGVYRRRHQHDRLRARARVARLRGRDVFRSEKSAPFQSLEPFGSSQSPRARPAPHESLDVFAAPSARGRER